MKRAGARVGVCTRFTYDGEVIEIVEIHPVKGAPEVLTKDLRTQLVRRFALSELMFSERSRRHCQLEQSEGDFRRFASAIHQVACDV